MLAVRVRQARVVVGSGPGLPAGVTGLRPALTRPADFAAFWRGTLTDLARADPDIVSERVDEAAGAVLSTISFRSLGGARIHGYWLRRVEDIPRPLVVHAHGYNSSYEVRRDWAEAGCHVVGFDVRGFGRSRAAVPDLSTHGWIATGLESAETAVLRGAVCDYVRAMDVGRLLLDRRGSAVTCVVAHGVSFAGALAVLAEGQRPAANLLAVAVPTVGWFERRRRLRLGGSAAELNAFIEASPPEVGRRAMEVLRYFDVINSAGLVRAPVLVGIGRVDPIVPAETVYAVVNHLPGEREVWELPVSHSDRPEETHWERFERRWLELATGPLAS